MASVIASAGNFLSENSLLSRKRLKNFDTKGVSFTLVTSIVWAWLLFLWRQLFGQPVTLHHGVGGGSVTATGSNVRQRLPRSEPKMESVQQKGGGDSHSNPGHETETRASGKLKQKLKHNLRELVVHAKNDQGVMSEVDQSTIWEQCGQKEDTPPRAVTEMSASKIRELEEDPFRGFHEYRDF